VAIRVIAYFMRRRVSTVKASSKYQGSPEGGASGAIDTCIYPKKMQLISWGSLKIISWNDEYNLKRQGSCISKALYFKVGNGSRCIRLIAISERHIYAISTCGSVFSDARKVYEVTIILVIILAIRLNCFIHYLYRYECKAPRL
jgi:hypothetical protein